MFSVPIANAQEEIEWGHACGNYFPEDGANSVGHLREAASARKLASVAGDENP